MSFLLPREIQERTFDYQYRGPWLVSRFPFLGCSELAGALGLSDFANLTPFSVWDRHVGEPPTGDPDPNEWEGLKWGHKLEGVILNEFAERHLDLRVEHTPSYRVTSHPVYPRIRGTPDGLCWNEAGVLVAGVDAKNVGSYRKHDFVDVDKLPADILIQGTSYCELFDVPLWYFCILIGGNEYREFEVARDTNFVEGLFVQALDWWAEFVEPKPPVHPPADGSKTAGEMLAKIYGNPREQWVEPTTEGILLADKLKAVRLTKKNLTEEERLYAQQLQEMAKDTFGMRGVFSWKPDKDGVNIDWHAAFLELAERFAPKEETEFICNTHTSIKPGRRSVRIIKPRKSKHRGNWK
ncbi:MAG: YqaJ viral recombinase family protein [Planctomycetota bacterium]